MEKNLKQPLVKNTTIILVSVIGFITGGILGNAMFPIPIQGVILGSLFGAISGAEVGSKLGEQKVKQTYPKNLS